jgi:hypothetical protein
MNYLAAIIFCAVWGIIIVSHGHGSIFIELISLIAVIAGAACFALAASSGQRLARLGQGALLTGALALLVGLIQISNSFNPADLSLLGKQFVILFLGPFYGFSLYTLTKLLDTE